MWQNTYYLIKLGGKYVFVILFSILVCLKYTAKE